MSELRQKIEMHIAAYRSIGLFAPPPIRITIEEWKKEFQLIKKSKTLLNEDTQWDEIKVYAGVEIEIVVKIN